MVLGGYVSAILEVKNLIKHFGGIKAIDGVSLKIPKLNERIIGIIGPNGSGKTTLINLITGFLRPDRGEIIYNGTNITHEPARLRALKGLVRSFQLPSTFNNLSVEENIALSVYRRILMIRRKSVDLEAFYKRVEKNNDIRAEIEFILDIFNLTKYRFDLLGKLPYGLKRLTEVAMCYALKPKILFLDEPFAGLNDVEIERLCETLLSIVKNNYIDYLVIVEHKITWLRIAAERLLVMFEGKLIADGETETVLNSEEVNKLYWGKV